MSPSPEGRMNYLWLKGCAITALVLGRRNTSLALFGRMLRRWPNDAYVLSSRLNVLAQTGQKDAALADARALVAAHPQRSAAYWFNLAYMLEEAGHLDEAENAFRRTLKMDPELDRAWYGLGLVLIRQRRLDDAVAALKRNTEMQPMSPYAWYQLARVHVDRQDPDAARKVIRHLKGFEPKVAAQLERETGLGA